VKSSAGYFVKSGMDPIDLFIGQEGTLSVITEIELALVRKPLKILSSFVFFGKEEDAWFFAAEARDISKRKAAAPCGAPVDALSIEYFDSNALGLLRSKKAAIPESACSAIFFEQETSPGLNEEDALSGWMSLIKKHNASLDDTWVAMSEKDAENFTALRHAIPEAVNDIIRHRGFSKISTDIAVPDRAAIEMMGFYRSVLSDKGLEHVVFGHIGENHVHVNILPNNEAEAASAKEAALLFVRMGVSAGGSVSAEHGIGKIKRAYLEEMYGKSGIRDMARIKKAFDPHWILGQDNIFPKDLASQI
jgi:D-lactate dehydrogenase (cytochrome)